MLPLTCCVSPLNFPLSPFQRKFPNPLRKTLIPTHQPKKPKPFSVQSLIHQSPSLVAISSQNHSSRRSVRSFAGRSKKKPDGSSGGRIMGNAELRRQAKRNARVKSKKLAESLFYRLKNPKSNYPNNFSEEELQMIGLGYDRMVRFMEKDDPNLRHPYDWYKYGEFGPYSWRGIVLGEPIRGGMLDECVTLIGEVKDHEEWDEIEQFEMASEFGQKLKKMDPSVGFRYFWVFVRHPRWRVSELPWQQWTLVSEVVVEAGKQRLDKWSLMGRLGNQSRASITQCAAWMRPDIIYVKRPVYQCRFEPQDEFFKAMMPLLDPETEQNFLFEVEVDDGKFERCTYFGGLCKLVRMNQKAFVDDVVNAFEKLSDEKKCKCLDFLLTNHPVQILHPYTQEWKTKLEEMELGCDAPSHDDDGGGGSGGNDETQIVDWIEEDGDDDDAKGEDDDPDDTTVMDMEGDGDDELGIKEEVPLEEEDEKYWENEFANALQTNEGMEKLVKRSMKISDERHERQLRAMEEKQKGEEEKEKKTTGGDGDELAMRGRRAKVSPKEWQYAGIGPWRKRIKKSKIPPALFLRSAVRPFTYRNLVKEIVLVRHAILDGDIKKR